MMSGQFTEYVYKTYHTLDYIISPTSSKSLEIKKLKHCIVEGFFSSLFLLRIFSFFLHSVSQTASYYPNENMSLINP